MRLKLDYKKTTKTIVFLIFSFIFGFAFISKSLAISDDTVISKICSDSGTSINPNTIIPMPQKIILGCDTTKIDSSWQIFTNTSDEYENFTANYLISKIVKTSSSTINPTLKNLVNISDINQIPEYSIIIGNPNQNEIVKTLATNYGINFNNEVTKGFNQGYILLVKPKQILILADSTAGTFYGTVSLTWLLKMNESVIQLPETKITDWPNLNIRGWYGQRGYNRYLWEGKSFSSEEELFDVLTKYKYNMWIGGVPAIASDSTQDFQNRSLVLKEYSRLRHFHIAADLTLKMSVLSLNPNYHEGFYSYNIPFEFNTSGTLVSSLPLPVDIKNPGFENDSNGDNIPDYWKFGGNTPDRFWSWDCTQSHSGNCSAKLTFLEGSKSDSRAIYLKNSDLNSSTITSYNLLPNRAYSLSFYTKEICSGDEDADPKLVITLSNSSGKGLYSKSYVTSSSENGNAWYKHLIKFTTSNNEALMTISVRSKTGSTLKFWLDDLELIDMTDKLKGVITTLDSRLHIWNSDRTVEYEEGKDYSITNYGSKNALDPYLADGMVIKRVDGGNIPSLASVKVDYDFAFSTDSDTANRRYQSLSDPYGIEDIATYRINPTMKTLSPEYVFIAMDEIRGMNRDSRAQKRNLLNYQVLANYLNSIAGKVKLNNPDTKVLVWDDMFSPLSNGGRDDYQIQFGGKSGKSWYALDLLDKNIIPISWYYDTDNYMHKMTGSYQLYGKYRFSYMVAPWNTLTNIKWWSYLANNSASGLISTEWGVLAMDTLINSANYSWNTVKSQPELVSPENLEVCDGRDNDGNALYWSNDNIQSSWPSNIDEGFDLQNDAFNCGSCGNICYAPHSYYSCVQGTCHFNGCYENFTDSNNSLSDGCENNKSLTPTSALTPTLTLIPTSIKIFSPSSVLSVGNSMLLTATINPSNVSNKKVKWVSYDANIATIDASGLVTAKKGGRVMIEVMSLVAESVTDSIVIQTVTSVIPTPTSALTITPTSISYDINQDGKINSIDFSIVKNAVGNYNEKADLNSDGLVNSIDINLIKNNIRN